MTNLTLFAENGLEILIDTQTGEAFCTQAAYCRMSGKASSTISDRVRALPENTLKTAEITTPFGVKQFRLISADLVYDWAFKDNLDLAKKMGTCGATVFLHQQAGFKVKSEAITPSSFEEKAAKILAIAEEYETLKACAKNEMPGLSSIMTNLAGQKALPPATTWFTASEWVNRNASHLTTRQRANFFKDIAASHRLLIDEPPVKVERIYAYNNRHEFLFWQKLDQIQRHVPVDAEAIKGEKDFNKVKLTIVERSLIGKNTKIATIVQQFGYCTKANPGITSKVKDALLEAAGNKQLRLKKNHSYVTASEKVLKFIKWWLLNNV